MALDHLPTINLCLFTVQAVLHGVLAFFFPTEAAVATIDNPIAPDGYTKWFWIVIYVATFATVITDNFYPKFSFYPASSDPPFSRHWFLLTCLMNIAYVICDHWLKLVHLALFNLVLLWVTLLPLYLLLVRHPIPRVAKPLVHYFASEFAIHVYFGWVTTQAIVAIAASIQKLHGAYLSFGAYAVLLTLLVVFAMSSFIYGNRDPVVSLVVVWVLVGLTLKTTKFPDTTQLTFEKLQAEALMAAISLVALSLIELWLYLYRGWRDGKFISEAELLKRIEDAFETTSDYGTV